MLKNIIGLGLIAGFVLLAGESGFCQSANKEKSTESAVARTTRVRKEIQGEVTGKSFEAISICYQRDENGAEHEIMIPIDQKDLKINHKEGLDQIEIGDIVSIEYDETSEEVAGGVSIKRKGRIIHFIRQGIREPGI